MVTKISIPKISSIDFLKKILEARVNNPKSLPGFYTKISSDLLDGFQNYIKNKGNPEVIQFLDFSKYVDDINDVDKRKDTLRNLYLTKNDDYITPILNDLRSNHGLQFCPYCGEEVIPSTLDHYLPKEKYPEYSICLANLIPMCTKCQGKDAKGEKTLNLNNNRYFLNPYYEYIDEFLVLKILPPFEVPDFVLDLNNSVDKKQYSLLANHVIELGIYDRFLRFAKTKHIHLMKLSKKNRQTGNPIKNKIEIYLEDVELKSVNTWSAIYYRSVLENLDLLDYLDNGFLPDYI